MMGASPTLTFITSVIIGDAAYWIIRCPAETVKTRVQTGVCVYMYVCLRVCVCVCVCVAVAAAQPKM